MFLDYWGSRIVHYKKIDGDSDDKLATEYKNLFATLTHGAYDNHVKYQLLDMIRNQTAHVQSPVNRIHVGLDGNEAFALRDEKKKKCKNGENKKNILRSQPEEIVLSPLVRVTAECLRNIHAGLIDFQIDELIKAEMEIIGEFIGFIISKNHLFEPWLLMDADQKVPKPYHIRDMKAYGYILDRMSKKQSEAGG